MPTKNEPDENNNNEEKFKIPRSPQKSNLSMEAAVNRLIEGNHSI